MSKHTHEDIMDALRVIKDTCDGNISCSTCPFLDTGRSWSDGDKSLCYMKNHTPNEWVLRTPHLTPWRAFI